MNWVQRVILWLAQVKQTTDPNCPHCLGLGYDASGYACTCVKEKK